MVIFAPDQLEVMFLGSEEDHAWVGLPFEIEPEFEMLPLQFQTLRYLMQFQSLGGVFDGDEAFAQEMANYWSNGVVPAQQHRLIKFYRTDAQGEEDLFNPKAWPLSNPLLIFQFGRLLVDAILQHAQAFPFVVQYAFIPGNNKLDSLYDRLYKAHATTCNAAGFHPILALNGNGIHGFEKATTT